MTKKAHFVGVGGEGLYYLAQYLHYSGWQVSGSDLKKSARTEKLKQLGIKIYLGHKAANLKENPDLIIISPAVPQEVAEIREAKKKGIKIYAYRQALDWVFNNLDRDSLTAKQEMALKKSNLAPLYFVDFSRTRLIGVTGTDGKTTTATMIHYLLEKSGLKTGLMTTVAAKIGQEEMSTGLHITTPSAQKLALLLEKMLNKNPEALVLEITSHGLAHHRVEGLKLDIGVYTNITNEHLDFHKNWENYVDDKARMTAMINKSGIVVLNKDDRAFSRLKKKAEQEKIRFLTYGRQSSDLVFGQTREGKQGLKAGISFKNKNYQLNLPVQGEYNLYNAAAALLAVEHMGLNLKKAIQSLGNFSLPKGRMEIIQKTPFWLIVDFAHTANAIEKALVSARRLVSPQGKLIVVFGAVGERDKSKRKEMGKNAARLADVLVLVPDDSRGEKTKDIIDQILVGVEEIDPGRQVKRFDEDKPEARKKGIEWAVNQAQPGDVVILCGKGHEKSLCFKGEEYPWNDSNYVKELLNQSS